MWKYIGLALLALLITVAGILFFLARPDEARLPQSALEGREPQFTEQRRQILPTVKIAKPVGWAQGAAPVPAKGLVVTRFAEGLDHPRSLYRLPNGDILVAESRAPEAVVESIKDRVASYLMSKAGAAGGSANRITLLRDADGDGRAEQRHAFLTGLNSPYGMALVGNTLYVANTDAIIGFPYKGGETRITTAGTKLADLPAAAPNMHWTRSLVANRNGNKLYVGIGANSNIAEGGLDIEENRAAIIEIDLKTRQTNIFASGLRNPVGMAWEPLTGELWTVVNERDMLGSDLVPDYLTRVDFAAFYGWPWNYWGGYEDTRVQPSRPDLREYTKRPEYGLGAHVAPLGLSFAAETKLGEPFERGAFIGLHGSWNRVPLTGYKVVFVPFSEKGMPQGKPVDLLGGFLTADGQAQGRPVDVLAASDGALLVSDDVGNIIWRVGRVSVR
jgi:glucose/arabinose dehydrogenase